jgi:hypothetical protein
LGRKYFNINKESVQTLEFPEYKTTFNSTLVNLLGIAGRDICRLPNSYHLISPFTNEILFSDEKQIADLAFYEGFVYIITKNLVIYQYEINFNPKTLVDVTEFNKFVTNKNFLNPRFLVSQSTKTMYVFHEDGAHFFDLERNLVYPDVKSGNVLGYQPRRSVYSTLTVAR